jgi:hypothetical protein
VIHEANDIAASKINPGAGKGDLRPPLLVLRFSGRPLAAAILDESETALHDTL